MHRARLGSSETTRDDDVVGAGDSNPGVYRTGAEAPVRAFRMLRTRMAPFALTIRLRDGRSSPKG